MDKNTIEIRSDTIRTKKCFSFIICVTLIITFIYQISSTNTTLPNFAVTMKTMIKVKNINVTKSNISKIAFLFLTRDKLLRPDIWGNLFANKHDKKYYNIYVHCKFCDKINEDQPYLFDNIIPKHLLIRDANRRIFPLVEASNALFKTAFNHDKNNQKFILLSEGHIPLYNISTIYSKLIVNNRSYYATHIGHRWRYNLIKKNYISKLMNTSNFNSTPFENVFVPFNHFMYTSQWIVLDRYLINYLLKYESYWNQFYRQVVCVPDENYYSTLFEKYLTKQQKNELIIDKTLTYLEMSYPGKLKKDQGHPRIFKNISSNFIKKLRNDSYLFLRKVNQHTKINISYLNF
eukprot:504551_1